jgi:hypothetical protein
VPNPNANPNKPPYPAEQIQNMIQANPSQKGSIKIKDADGNEVESTWENSSNMVDEEESINDDPMAEDATITDTQIINAIWNRMRLTLNLWQTNGDIRLSNLKTYGRYKTINDILVLFNGTPPTLFQNANAPIIRLRKEVINKVDEGIDGRIPNPNNPNYILLRNQMFPDLNRIMDNHTRLNASITNFLPNSDYAVCCSDKAIYIDYYLSSLVKDILNSQAEGNPRGVFASTGLYSVEHCDAVWDFVVLVMMHELCHWARNNQQHFIDATGFAPFYDPSEFYDPSQPFATQGSFDLYPIFLKQGNIEHGSSWEWAYYNRIVTFRDNDINPNVFAWYSYHLSGIKNNPTSSARMRQRINARFTPQNGLAYYRQNASGLLVPIKDGNNDLLLPGRPLS